VQQKMQQAEETDMSAAAKLNREPMPEEISERATVRDDMVNLFLRGVERIAEVQKQCINLAVQHNTEMIEVLKKTAEKVPGAPKLPMLEVANGAVKGYSDTQKSAIDFVVEQSRIWTDLFKDRTTTVKKATESTTNVAKQTLEHSFAVQKKALENTAAQTKAVVDAAKHQFGFTGSQADAMTDTFQRGVDTIVEAQKELMDLVTH
jgi:hypothetical protein